jgi:hypothetical protein
LKRFELLCNVIEHVSALIETNRRKTNPCKRRGEKRNEGRTRTWIREGKREREREIPELSASAMNDKREREKEKESKEKRVQTQECHLISGYFDLLDFNFFPFWKKKFFYFL